MDTKELIKQRIDAATPDGLTWNGWPSQMEVVSVRRLDLTDAKQAYDAGKLIGSGAAGAFRQIRGEFIPPEIAADIDHRSLAWTWFIPAMPRGQGDDIEKRNILAVFEEGSWNAKKVVVVEIGCKHDYETKSPFRMYHEGKCRKCGHTYSVDTSD